MDHSPSMDSDGYAAAADGKKDQNRRSLTDQIMFFSFGMFIIDEIEFLSGTQPSKHNLPGGAGLYALLGARLLSPYPFSRRCSWILDLGSDAPAHVAEQIHAWRTATIIRHDRSRLTTRAWNGYGRARPSTSTNNDGDSPSTNPKTNENVDADSDHRAFAYLTPKRRLDVEDLSSAQSLSRSYHMVCSPSRCSEIVRKLDTRRRGRDTRIVVWEPIPDLCTPAELANLRRAASGVDVVSPNAEELEAFFAKSSGDPPSRMAMVQRLMGWEDDDEDDDDEMLNAGTDADADADANTAANSHKPPACIVREGKDGSTIYFAPRLSPSSSPSPSPFPSPSSQQLKLGHTSTRSAQEDPTPPENLHLHLHLPAYHTPAMAKQVVDPTGGGNTYLGALALGMAYTTTTTTTTTGSLTSSNTAPPEPKPESMPKPLRLIWEFVSSLDHRQKLSQGERALVVAAIGACVAAGFAIEQNGVPGLNACHAADGDGGGGGDDADNDNDNNDIADREVEEGWGGEHIRERVELYLRRERDGIQEQLRRLPLL